MFFDVEHLIQQAVIFPLTLSQNRETVDDSFGIFIMYSLHVFPYRWMAVLIDALVQMTARVSDIIRVAQITLKLVDNVLLVD